MDATGIWDQRHDEVDDLTRARRLPSPQLVGAAERTTLDLNALSAMGVELVGRWAAVRDDRALFSGGPRNVFSLADLKMARLLDTFDEWARTHGRDGDVEAPERFAPTRVPDSSRLQLDLRSGEIRTIVWATGFRPDHRWLDVPEVDPRVSCAMTAASSTAPVSTRWGCRCCGGASPPSCTASRTTRAR